MFKNRVEKFNDEFIPEFENHTVDVTVSTPSGPVLHSIPILINRFTGLIEILHIHNEKGAN
tara:strand:- start:2993 stop:3175 length:183 start_codon:yes stop_codon:yes gene_type:complete